MKIFSLFFVVVVVVVVVVTYHVSIFQYISNKMHMSHSLFYLETALHVSGGTSTHHQECKQLYHSIWYLSRRYCLSAAIVDSGR